MPNHKHLRPPYIPPALVAAQDVPGNHNHHHHQEKTYLGTRRLLESRSGLPEGSSDDGLRTGAHGVALWPWEMEICRSVRQQPQLRKGFADFIPPNACNRKAASFFVNHPLHDMAASRVHMRLLHVVISRQQQFTTAAAAGRVRYLHRCASCSHSSVANASRHAFGVLDGPTHQQMYTSRNKYTFGSAIRSLSTPASRALKKAVCPFRILGVPTESTYAVVKKSFLRIAMQHHPDVVGELEGDEKQKSVDLFMKSRQAFESIVEVEGGMAALREEVEMEKGLKKQSKMSDEEFDAWFLDETGHNNPFSFDIDPATMREVADMTDSIGGGLDRDGGMWTLANMVSRSVKDGKESASVLRLEAGEIREDEEPVDGVLRRRRRRRR